MGRSQASAQGLLRIFLIPANIRITEGSDVTQVAIEMDRLLIFMNPGDNYYVRNSSRSTSSRNCIGRGFQLVWLWLASDNGATSWKGGRNDLPPLLDGQPSASRRQCSNCGLGENGVYILVL